VYYPYFVIVELYILYTYNSSSSLTLIVVDVLVLVCAALGLISHKAVLRRGS
jgi:hypothetical protein